jgi:hypothetical protein
MKATQHSLVGYDPETEAEEFELQIPARIFPEVGAVVSFDDDDPEAVGCYELSDLQARRIANLVGNVVQLPAGLDFFLEANSG